MEPGAGGRHRAAHALPCPGHPGRWGSEFQATFETECQRRCIRLFALPPRSPKLNGHVERAHRTHTEEFYEIVDLPDTIPELNRLLQDWERVYNTIRPHQALGYRTPLQAVLQFQQQEVT